MRSADLPVGSHRTLTCAPELAALEDAMNTACVANDLSRLRRACDRYLELCRRERPSIYRTAVVTERNEQRDRECFGAT
jgi:hypothetical protein